MINILIILVNKMDADNCYLALYAPNDANSSIVKLLLDDSKAIKLDLNDIATGITMIYIRVVNFNNVNHIQTYIDNVTTIFEIKNYKFVGMYGEKLFFVNKSVICNDIYYYTGYDSNDATNFKTRIETYQLADLAPIILYCGHFVNIENNDKFRNVTTKKILPCTIFGKLREDCDFYLVVKREYFTKCAIQVTTSTVLKK